MYKYTHEFYIIRKTLFVVYFLCEEEAASLLPIYSFHRILFEIEKGFTRLCQRYKKKITMKAGGYQLS